MNSKNLHKHALPVFVAIMSLTALSIGFSISLAAQDESTRQRLLSSLTKPAVDIKPAKNGLAQVNLRAQPDERDNLPEVKAINSVNISLILTKSATD